MLSRKKKWNSPNLEHSIKKAGSNTYDTDHLL